MSITSCTSRAKEVGLLRDFNLSDFHHERMQLYAPAIHGWWRARLLSDWLGMRRRLKKVF